MKRSDEDTLIPPLWEKMGGKLFYLFNYVPGTKYITRLHAAQFYKIVHIENCQHTDQKQAYATRELRSRNKNQPTDNPLRVGQSQWMYW